MPENHGPWRDRARAALYLAILACLNLYICRDLFRIPAMHMNSMHGFWMALSEHAGASWWHPSWWPYWDNGMPFEFTYAPLMPALMAISSSVLGISSAISFGAVAAIVYTLLPLTFFFAIWRLTREAGWSFAAALFYSLASPTELLVPDDAFRWSRFFESRRLFLSVYWDDIPHLLALALLPISVLFIVRLIETDRRRYLAAAALSIAVATYASAFAPVITAIAAVSILATIETKTWRRNTARVIAAGVLAYACAAAFLPPSLIRAIRAGGANHWRGEPGWTVESLTALAIVVFGFTAILLVPHWTDWKPKFVVLATFVFSSIPMMAAYLHHQFLPQPVRYEPEMELGIALLIVFGVRRWFEKMPAPLRAGATLLLCALALEQTSHFHLDAQKYLALPPMSSTVEYRAATWADRNLDGVRVMLPGSVAQWADAFTGVVQFSGASWSQPYNRVQQRGLEAIYTCDARVSLAWLEAFGVGAVGVPAPNSEEYWKGIVYPAKFDHVLPVLWSGGGVTIYRVPPREKSLAHVIPESALVRVAPSRIDDVANLENYDSALQDAPSTEMHWEGRNRIRVRARASNGQVLSLQVSYHPGWHAREGARGVPIFKDGLGLMWMRPDCGAGCDIQLDYDGGFELRFCRYLSAFAMMVVLGLMIWPERRDGLR